MKRNMIFKNMLVAVAFLATGALFTACSDWDDHYDAGKAVEGTATSTIWENISSNVNLSQFADLIRKTGYDDVLNTSQTFTVWAPLNGTFDYDDLGYGHQHEILADDCGDFLIRRSDGVIAYQLAVVVDDSLMGVNEVVRGHDLLASSARQSYIARLLGFEPPRYGHVPLLVAPDGRRLSKRDGDLDLGVLRARGIHPEQVIGSLAHAIDLAEAGEELTATQFVERFSWEAIRMHVADVAVDDSFILGR